MLSARPIAQGSVLGLPTSLPASPMRPGRNASPPHPLLVSCLCARPQVVCTFRTGITCSMVGEPSEARGRVHSSAFHGLATPQISKWRRHCITWIGKKKSIGIWIERLFLGGSEFRATIHIPILFSTAEKREKKRLAAAECRRQRVFGRSTAAPLIFRQSKIV